MPWRAVAAAVVLVGLWASVLRGDEVLAPEVLQDIKAATVFIKLKVNSIDLGSGSGFVIRHEDDATLIATNAHVVRTPEILGATPIQGERKLEVTVVFNSGGKHEEALPAEILAQNPAQDLAILRVKGATSKPRPIDFEHPPKLHETMTVFAFGFPFGSLLAANERNPAITVTRAAVSSIRQDELGEDALIQVDGALNPGNSGGPIVDSKGALVAVLVSGIPGSGLAFGIPTARLDRTMRGDIAAIAFRARGVGEDKAAVDVRLQLADPLNRIKSSGINYVPGPAKSVATEAGQRRVPLDGCETLVLKREGQFAVGEFELPVKAGESLRFVVQPTFVDESGATVVMSSHAIEDDFSKSDRKVYAFASTDGKIKGRIVWTATGWVENSENRTNPKKPLKIVVQFTELGRTDEYVELRNTKGAVYRLFPDRIDILQKSGRWTTGLGGAWVKFTEGDARIAAQAAVKPAAVAPAPAAPVVTARAPKPAAVVPRDPSRSVWKYTDADRKRTGSFTKTGEGWLEEYEEQRESGARRLKFKYRETQRTEEYIELADNRAISVRLYDDRAESRSGPGEWERLCEGGWEGRTPAAETATVAATGNRQVWRFTNQKNKSGTFSRTKSGWAEDNELKTAGGATQTEHHDFRQVAENDDCIELLDDRGVSVRLYADRAEAKLANKPWFRLYEGRWDAPAAEAETATDTAEATAPTAPADSRTVWKYENQKNASGTFRRSEDGWVEEKETKVGRTTRVETITYRETASTDDYIEMIDEKRNITNRIYADHTEWRFGNGRWNREFSGAWVADE